MKKDKPKQFSFKIVAGELKGKTIISPDLGITRPPLTRLRKAIFDFLQPYLENATYLDLYSGTGSYLFEATSRRVLSALGIEIERKLAETINLQARTYAVADRLFCQCADVFEAIHKLSSQGRQFDIIMMAPPQYKGFIDKTLALMVDNKITHPDSMILCQHDKSEKKKIDFQNFTIDQQRKYGNTIFTILKIGN